MALVLRCLPVCAERACDALGHHDCGGGHHHHGSSEGNFARHDALAACGACPAGSSNICKPGAAGFPRNETVLPTLAIGDSCATYLHNPWKATVNNWQAARQRANLAAFTDAELADDSRQRIMRWFSYEGGLKGARSLGCKPTAASTGGRMPELLRGGSPAAACLRRSSLTIYFIMWKCANDFIHSNLGNVHTQLQRQLPEGSAATIYTSHYNFSGLEHEYVARDVQTPSSLANLAHADD